MDTNKPDFKLSQAELEMVSKLPEAQQATVAASLIAAKREAFEKRQNDPENIRRRELNKQSRTVFSTKYNPATGTLSVRGLGRSWPVSLYKGEWERLFANLDAIKAEVAKMPEHTKKTA